MSKRKSENNLQENSTKKKRGTKGQTFAWGQAGLYSKFLDLCVDQFEKSKRNVFEDGGARDDVAAEINKFWPGCNSEKIRAKIRLVQTQKDLVSRNKNLVPENDEIITPLTKKKYDNDFDSRVNEDDEEDEEDDEDDDETYSLENDLPPDCLLRPEAVHIPGAVKQPEGWKVKVPGIVFQIFSSKGYKVTAQHTPGDEWIKLTWEIQPPTWEEFLVLSKSFKEANVNFDNEEVKQQVKAWVPNNWFTLVPAPIPYIPDSFRTGGHDHLKYVAIPYAAPVIRTATMWMDDKMMNDLTIGSNT